MSCAESVASVGVGPGLRMRYAMCAVNGARPGGEGREERTQDVCRDLAPALGLDRGELRPLAASLPS